MDVDVETQERGKGEQGTGYENLPDSFINLIEARKILLLSLAFIL